MRIALASTGPLSGKTTLANYLRAVYGFVVACHVCTLVQSFVEKENNTNYPYHEFTADDVFSNKEFYRPALQDHGIAVGFNDPAMTGYWIERTIANATVGLGSSAVLPKKWLFDSIRGNIQAQYLHDAGWTVVQLQISEAERERRAGLMGKEYSDIQAAMQRQPAIEAGIDIADMVIMADGLTVEKIARMVLKFGELRYADTTATAIKALDDARHGDYTLRS